MTRTTRSFALILFVALAYASLGARANPVKETAEDVKDGAVAAGKHTGEAAKTVGKTIGSKARTFGKGVGQTGRKVGTGTGHRVKSAYQDSKGRVKQTVRAVKAGQRDSEGAASAVPDPTR